MSKKVKAKAEKEKPVDAMLIQDTVDNPLFGPTSPEEHRSIKVLRSLRDDALGRMFARKQIGAAQLHAGRRFQAEFEAAGIGRLGSSGDLKEPVDGTPRHRDGVNDRQVAAMRSLNGYRLLLGTAGYRLVEAAIIEQISIREVADSGNAMPGKRASRDTGTLLRFCLSTLAKAMGYAT